MVAHRDGPARTGRRHRHRDHPSPDRPHLRRVRRRYRHHRRNRASPAIPAAHQHHGCRRASGPDRSRRLTVTYGTLSAPNVLCAGDLPRERQSPVAPSRQDEARSAHGGRRCPAGTGHGTLSRRVPAHGYQAYDRLASSGRPSHQGVSSDQDVSTKPGETPLTRMGPKRGVRGHRDEDGSALKSGLRPRSLPTPAFCT